MGHVNVANLNHTNSLEINQTNIKTNGYDHILAGTFATQPTTLEESVKRQRDFPPPLESTDRSGNLLWQVLV